MGVWRRNDAGTWAKNDYSYDHHYYDINVNINLSTKVKIQKITSYGSQKSWEPRVQEKIERKKKHET